MQSMSPGQWIAKCAERLHDRWRTVPATELEEVAVELWRDPALRELDPTLAAARWLQPITDAG